jgi:hypothetical protein
MNSVNNVWSSDGKHVTLPRAILIHLHSYKRCRAAQLHSPRGGTDSCIRRCAFSRLALTISSCHRAKSSYLKPKPTPPIPREEEPSKRLTTRQSGHKI